MENLKDLNSFKTIEIFKAHGWEVRSEDDERLFFLSPFSYNGKDPSYAFSLSGETEQIGLGNLALERIMEDGLEHLYCIVDGEDVPISILNNATAEFTNICRLKDELIACGCVTDEALIEKYKNTTLRSALFSNAKREGVNSDSCPFDNSNADEKFCNCNDDGFCDDGKIEWCFSIDEDSVHEFVELMYELGLDPDTAVNIFIKACVRNNGIPFPVKL